MAKKYLLYIHEELFAKEPKKSRLVNNLLERHYHDTVGRKTQEQIKEKVWQTINERPDTKVVGAVASASLGSASAIPKSATRPDTGNCKIHGTPLTPQGKCLQKGCKYA